MGNRSLRSTLFALLLAPSLALAGPERAGPSLTVYSSADPAGFDPQRFVRRERGGHDPGLARRVPGFGVVKETRALALDEGVNALAFTDVAAFIDPTTVSFKDLAHPEATEVLEQQFQFDLVSAAKLLEKYVDREITLRLPNGEGEAETIAGTLLAARGDRLVVDTGEGLRLVPEDDARIALGELPGGLETKPTLRWLVRSEAAGERRIRTTYQTDGLTWRADYNLVLGARAERADLGAWVSLLNLSGKTYADARLKLIAGDVRRVEARRGARRARAVGPAAMEARGRAGFEEESFYEYHLYTLPRRTTVRQNATQQLTLFPTARDVATEKVLVYYGLPEDKRWGYAPSPRTDRNLGVKSNKKVDVYIRFENRAENNLGRPLPRGKVRVYKERAGGMEFVGEDLIDHTPRDETVRIKTGQAFDVVGERKRMDFHIDHGDDRMRERFRIELRNHKREAVSVIVKENLYRWVNWRIAEKSDPFERIDARTIHFDVEVPADGKKVVTYTVRYAW